MTPELAARLLPAFEAAVADTLRHLETLEPLLDRERDALGGRDPDALNAVVREKLEVLGGLEKAMRGLDGLFAHAGLPGAGKGGDALVAHADASGDLGERWERLKTLAANVDRLNTRNGSLTKQAQRGARTALSILTGRQATDAHYDRKGRDKTRLAGQSLGEA
jgi:flagellar biosynthesis/type III secretory pathway chaperone